jgi:hypothetical protein
MSFKPNVIDHPPCHEDLLFDTSTDRCRYIGLRPKYQTQWLEENPKKWWRFLVFPKAAAALAEGRSESGAAIAQNRSTTPLDEHSESKSESAQSSVTTPAMASRPADHRWARAVPTANEVSPAELAKYEIAIGGRSYGSRMYVADVLDIADRTLSRRRPNGNGLPHVKIAGIYYELDAIQEWAVDKGRRRSRRNT